MVQFNLLPDVKIQYLKARRQKHLVVMISTFAALAGIAIIVVLVGIVYGVQKKNLSDLNKDIASNTEKLKDTPDLDKILTVQNQLKVLPGLHDQKPATPRLFTFVAQVTPAQASISKLNIDYAQNKLILNGAANSLDTVNVFTDTLKFTTYSTKDGSTTDKQAFTNVVLASFSRDKNGATYTINVEFDPAIFSQQSEVTLTVPKIVTTRSAVEQPGALFQSSGGQ